MSVTEPPIRGEGLAFHDARGCKEWLGALPLTHLAHAQSLLHEALRSFDAAVLAPLERLKCLELIRDKVAFLQGEQRARYVGKTLPLSAADADSWKTGRALLERLEASYRKALEAAASDAGARPHQALIAQRIVRYAGAQMLFHAAIYRRFEPQLWERLHRQYAAAEAAGFAEERVKDSVEGEDGTSSVAEAYVQVVMEQAAYLAELTPRQMDLAALLARRWARRVAVRARPPDTAAGPLPLTVDFDQPIGARPRAPSDLGPSLRALDMEQVSKSLRKRIHALGQGEEPAALGLPPEVPAGEAADQLKRLHRLWCEGAPPRPPAKVPGDATAGLVFGLNEIYFYVTGGKAFEQPDRKRELTRQEKQDIEVFGRVTERTQSMMLSEHNFSVEKWGVIDEMAGGWRLQRPANSTRGVAIGRLVAMRVGDTAPFFLGRVRALAQETDGRVIATVSLFPGRPEPLAARAGDARNRANALWSQGFRLPAVERLKVPESLVLPTGVASRGRGVEVWTPDGPKESTVYEVIDRGSDFDRVTIF